MRFFPRTARRRLLATTVVAVVGIGGLNLGTFSQSAVADDLKDQQKQVQKDISQAHDDLDGSSAAYRNSEKRLASARAQLAAARAELSSARARVTTAKAQDVQMQAALEAAEAKLATAQAELQAGTADLATQQQQVASVVSDIYTQGDPGMQALASLLDAQTPEDLMRASAAQDAWVSSETRTYNDLRAARVLLKVKRNQVEAAKEEVAMARQRAADHLVQMKVLERAQEQATGKVRSLVGERRSARASAQAARASDRLALQRLETQNNRIKEKLRQRALRAGASSTAPSNAGGFLSPPVSPLRVTSSYGMRVHPIYGYYSLHDGTDFGVSCNQPLYADADGVVAESYWNTAYGNRLVLDHGLVKGVGLASIYNHATRYTVGRGDRVKRGQVIGYVGSTGWSTGCHLHFTVLVNGSTVNPMGWL